MKIVPPPDSWGAIPSRAEERVADLLRQVDMGEQTICLYSLHLPRHEYKRMSEIDFLIITADIALVIEVKGGRVARRDGLWTFTNRYGEGTTKREGPFEQARSAMFALEDTVRDRRPRALVPMGYLVITPDQDLPPDPEWDRAHHLGPTSMSVTGLEDGLRRATRFWQSERGPQPGAIRDLVGLLRPDFDVIPTMASRISGLEAEYVRLAERQYDLIAGAERNPRLLCLGGAGSGKTLLALETARRAAAGGSSVLLTCKSPGLAQMLEAALVDTNVVVRSFDDATGHPPSRVLVVDEGQDVMDLDGWVRLDSLVEGGLDNGTWRIFCDPNNQAAVDGSYDPEVLAGLQERAVTVDLPFNCRNTPPVVSQTQTLTGADLGVARAGAGPAVEYARCASGADAATQLDAHLKRLRREEIDLSTVAVVTLAHDYRDSAALSTRAYGRGSLMRYTGNPTQSLPDTAVLLTASEVKGLEFAHVCVIDVASITDAWTPRLYVAMTRPTVSLWLGLGPEAWQQASRAL